MKVLLLTHRLPYPPDKGDRIRSFHLLRHLARRHSVHLAALSDEPVSETALHTLARLCEDVAVVPPSRLRWLRAVAALFTGRSLTTGLFYAPRLQKLLGEWTAHHRFDAVIGFCSSMAQYLVAAPLERMPALVDLVDVDSEKWNDFSQRNRSWRRWLYALEARRLRRFEAELAGRCSALTVVSKQEEAAYRAFQPAGRVAVVPNGVDLAYFNDTQLSGNLDTSSGERVRGAAAGSCTFVGALDYFPNVDGVRWFCNRVWPNVREKHPGAILTLVGRNPIQAVKRLGKLPGVRVVGSVPDVRPYVLAAHVAIAPLRIARGVQNKVLEAMALRRPVVVSPQVARGLPRGVAEAAIVAETPQDWTTQIERLLAQPSLASDLGALGRAAVEAACRWEICLGPWDDLLEQAASTRPAEDGATAIPSLVIAADSSAVQV